MTGLGTTVTVHYRDATVEGVRTAESRVSPLAVYASNWKDLQRLLDAGLPPRCGIYVLTGPTSGTKLAVRPGEANDLRRRLLEHASDPSKSEFTDIYAVTSVDQRLTKSDVRYIEARMHEHVAQLPGRSLEVERIPVVVECSAHERDDLEALFLQARVLLHAAGCRAFDAQGLPWDASVLDPEVGVVEVTLEASNDHEDEHELLYDGLWARGYPTSDGGFIVRAGSDIRVREGLALLPGISSRRRMLAERGVLGTIPGVTDRWRLLANVYCSSPLLAAKIATGAHVSRSMWQRISPEARLVLAK